MSGKIKADVLQALDDWRSGKLLRVPELGHVHAMKHSEEEMQAHPNRRQEVDLSKRLATDQERAYAYVFHLIDLFSLNGIPESHEAFSEACDSYEQTFEWGELPIAEKEVFNTERDAAESLAWKALIIGWKRAIASHGEERYIEVVNPAAAVSK